jgi:hypothetical protein
MMRLGLLVIVTGVLLGSGGCCGKISKLNNPPLPSHTDKWRKHQLGENTTVYGDFVLHKGESVNDSIYGIAAVNFYPAKCDHRDVPGEDLPSAELRFFRVSDNSNLCEFNFKRGSALLNESTCGNPDKLIWSVVEINDVNTQEGWVHFNLRLK